jgi:hypothetical protein
VLWNKKNEMGQRIGSIPKNSTVNSPCARRNKLYNEEESVPDVAAEGMQLLLES